MLVLGVDFETSGLSPTTDRITEIGAVLWDTDTKMPVGMVSELVFGDDTPPITEEITKLTGITRGQLELVGRAPEFATEQLLRLVMHAAVIVAHNGTRFDRLFYNEMLKRQGHPSHAVWFDTPWLDTITDIPYPSRVQTRKLTHLAAEHGFVNPFAHRALFDVLTMLTVLSHYDIHEVMRLAAEPSFELQALTQKPWMDNGASTARAKAHGYRWDGDRKVWAKTVKQSQLKAEKSHGEFPVIEKPA